MSGKKIYFIVNKIFLLRQTWDSQICDDPQYSLDKVDSDYHAVYWIYFNAFQ